MRICGAAGVTDAFAGEMDKKVIIHISQEKENPETLKFQGCWYPVGESKCYQDNINKNQKRS